MNERKFDMNRDGLGLLLFALGLFPAVLIVKALLGTSPIESISGDGPIALSWIRTLGGIPSLLVTAGVMFLGGRLFLFGRRDGLVRDALGIAGVALGTAVLLGAFSPTAGGRIGDATGGLVSSITHVVLGAIFGAVAVALAIWFTWLREERAPRIVLDSESGVDAILGEEADTGVSAAEARALIPEDSDPEIDPTRDPNLDEDRMLTAPRPLRSAPPPSPYPEDVRLKGQIPAGARPLQREQDVQREPASAPQPSSVYRWTAPRTDHSGDGLDAHLAHVEEPEVVFAAEPERELESVSDAGALAEGERWSDATEIELSASGEISGLGVDAAASAPAELFSALPRPSWEQSNLFTEADEPVDAYGTPLTLVEALRHEGGRGASEQSGEPVSARDQLAEIPTEMDFAPENEATIEDDPEFEAVSPAPVRTPGVGVVDEDSEEELTDADEDFEDGAVHEEDRAESDEHDESLEDEDEDEDADEDEDSGEEPEADEIEGDRLDEDDEYEVDDEEGADEVTTPSIAAEDLEPEPVEEAQADKLEEAVAEVASAPSPRISAPSSPGDGPLVELMERQAPARSDRPAKKVSADSAPAKLEPAPQPSAAERRQPPVETKRPAAESGEREMILKPKAVTPAQAIKSQAALPERAELLREAGCLFVDRGRVAVSMLQRQYGMDFDQACQVLDELQNLGLIGPYLGGQRRDILLTREEWLEKVGSA